MNFLINPHKVYRLVKQNRKAAWKPCNSDLCRCGHTTFLDEAVCRRCSSPANGKLGDETAAQLDSMYKGYAEP